MNQKTKSDIRALFQCCAEDTLEELSKFLEGSKLKPLAFVAQLAKRRQQNTAAQLQEQLALLEKENAALSELVEVDNAD